MFREVFFNKWILGGYALVILFGIGCYFWHQHQLAPYRRDAAETTEVARKREAPKKANTNDKTEQASGRLTESTMPTVITQTAEKPITETDGTRTKDTVSGIPKGVLVETQPSGKKDAVKVSPYGMGTYPEVPEGLLGGMVPSWEWSEEKKFKFGPEHMRNQEAIDRVMIKLWNQGDQEFYGAVGDYNTVYPLYPNTVYIKWNDIELPDGTIHRIISSYCAPADFPELTMEQQIKGEIPAGYRVLDMQVDAINVSEFLNTSNWSIHLPMTK